MNSMSRSTNLHIASKECEGVILPGRLASWLQYAEHLDNLGCFVYLLSSSMKITWDMLDKLYICWYLCPVPSQTISFLGPDQLLWNWSPGICWTECWRTLNSLVCFSFPPSLRQSSTSAECDCDTTSSRTKLVKRSYEGHRQRVEDRSAASHPRFDVKALHLRASRAR